MSPLTSKAKSNLFSPDEAGRRVAEWFAVMELSHELLLAGIRSRLNPGEDEWTLYRQWYEQQMDEHGRTIDQMVRRFNGRIAKHDS